MSKKAAKKKAKSKKVDKVCHVRIVGGTITLSTDPIPIKTRLHHQAVWHPHGGKMQIKFDKGQGSPFSKSMFSSADGTPCPSDEAVVRPVPPEYFGYTIWMTKKDGTVLKKDPGVDVDGSGPPKGAKKAARKKTARKKSTRKKATRKKAASKKATRKKTTKKK